MQTNMGSYTPSSLQRNTHPARSGRVPDSDILSESLQNELMTWRDWFTTGYFRIGDIALQIIEESHKKGLPVTKMRIYACIGRFCGKSGRTVRYYADVARFFPHNSLVRGAKGEVLPPYDILDFRAFAVASCYPDRWEEILEYALDHPRVSEEGLRVWLGQTVAASEIETVAASISSGDNGSAPGGISAGDEGYAPRPQTIDTGLHMLSDLIERIERVISAVPMRDSTKVEVFDCLGRLRNLLPEIFNQQAN